MRLSFKRSVAVMATATIMVTGITYPAQAQTDSASSSWSNEIVAGSVSYASIEALLNDPRVDQDAVRELANDPTATPGDFSSLFGSWGIDLGGLLGMFQQFIEILKEFFGGLGGNQPVTHDPDVVPAGEIPGITSRAAMNAICHGDSTLIDYRAEAKYTGPFRVYYLDTTGTYQAEVVEFGTYEEGQVLTYQRVLPKGLELQVMMQYQERSSVGNPDARMLQRVIHVKTNDCINPGN